jgi:exopolysaccharide production protein ExoZ
MTSAPAADRVPAGGVLKNVQVLRAIAATLVVLSHLHSETAQSDPGVRTLFSGFADVGRFGVDLFFVISGFIMIVTNWRTFGSASGSGRFFLRRLARIYPPYWIVLILISVAHVATARHLIPGRGTKTNVFASILLLPQVPLTRVLEVSWTLTFEMFFYAIFAVILLGPRRLLLPSLACWFVLELCAALAWHGSTNTYLIFCSEPFPIEFILGALIGYLYRLRMMPGALYLGAAGAIAALIMVVSGMSPWPVNANLERMVQFGLPAAAIVYGAVAWETQRGSVAPAWAVNLGDASYATYLWHMPIVIVLGWFWVRLHVHGWVSDDVALAFSFAIVLAVSLAAYRFIERPMTASLNARIGSAARPDGRYQRSRTPFFP